MWWVETCFQGTSQPQDSLVHRGCPPGEIKLPGLDARLSPGVSSGLRGPEVQERPEASASSCPPGRLSEWLVYRNPQGFPEPLPILRSSRLTGCLLLGSLGPCRHKYHVFSDCGKNETSLELGYNRSSSENRVKSNQED